MIVLSQKSGRQDYIGITCLDFNGVSKTDQVLPSDGDDDKKRNGPVPDIQKVSSCFLSHQFLSDLVTRSFPSGSP